MAEDLLEERVKKLERALESLAEVPKQLTRLGERVEKVEDRVTNVESQISQLRTEMRGGFSAVLEVIDSSSKATQTLYDEGRKETRELLTDLRNDVVQTLGTEMRVLHEDLVSRIALINKQ